MPAVDSSFVALPRFTTLAGEAMFTTLPMDVSSFGGAQFQVWRGEFRVTSPTPEPAFDVYFEESLDTDTWVRGPSAAEKFVIGENDLKFFSYNFRLRWFRLRIDVRGANPIVTCWAEGLLRGGGDGLWKYPYGPPGGGIAADIGRARSSPIPVTKGWETDAFKHRQQLSNMGVPLTNGPGDSVILGPY